MWCYMKTLLREQLKEDVVTGDLDVDFVNGSSVVIICNKNDLLDV